MGSGLVGIESKPTGNTFRPPPGFMDGNPSQLAEEAPSGDPMVSSIAMPTYLTEALSERLLKTRCGLAAGLPHTADPSQPAGGAPQTSLASHGVPTQPSVGMNAAWHDAFHSEGCLQISHAACCRRS